MTDEVSIIVEDDVPALARRGADLLRKIARKHVEGKGYFALAVSGGSTPRPMYRLLSQNPWVTDIPWEAMHLFWVDERMVPFGHPESNFGAAREDFLNRVPIPSGQVHPMPVDMSPQWAALKYQRELEAFFRSRGRPGPVFDLVLLGLGSDGHTASLFPGHPVLGEGKKWVEAVSGRDPSLPRLSLTLPILNVAREILFLVTGKEKARVIERIFRTQDRSLPAARIHPRRGILTWLLDSTAASLLSRP